MASLSSKSSPSSNKLLKEEPKDKNDNLKETVSVENIKIEEVDSSKLLNAHMYDINYGL